MSQERFARATRLHRTEIGALERGAKVASIPTLLIVADVAGVEPGELIRGLPVPKERRSRDDLRADGPNQSPPDRSRSEADETEAASRDTGRAQPRRWRVWRP
jgi:transcriptional regulator with XRE-family HTH domain